MKPTKSGGGMPSVCTNIPNRKPRPISNCRAYGKSIGTPPKRWPDSSPLGHEENSKKYLISPSLSPARPAKHCSPFRLR